MQGKHEKSKGGFVSLFRSLVLMTVSVLNLACISPAHAETIPESILSLDPDTITANVGDSFTLDAMIDPVSNEVTAVQLSISFDPGVLQLNSIDASTSPFSQILQSAFIDNTTGTASIIVGVPASSPPAPVTGTSLVATLGFHALSASEDSVISVDTSQAAALGISVNSIVSYIPATVTLNSSDTTPPSLSEVTPMPTLTSDPTPDYIFSTNEEGTITYSGDCSSSTSLAAVGDNIVTFNSLSDGAHSNCQITVTDSSGNVSIPLQVSAFTVDTIAPTVSITQPTDGQTVLGTVDIIAAASDGNAVAGVQFLLDGGDLGIEDIQEPYEAIWDTVSVSNGTYTLTARARDEAGNEALSDPVSVIVQNDGGSTVSIFEDDFEESLSWERDRIVNWYRNNPRNGTHSVRLRKTGSIEQHISLDGYKNIEVSFAMGAYSLDNANENVQALYFNGNTWQVLEQIDNGSAGENKQLNPYSFSLPSSVDGLQEFALRFKINGSGKKDYGYVDDVVVSGEAI